MKWYRPTRLKVAIICVGISIVIIGLFVPLETFTAISCGEESPTGRFSVLRGEFNQFKQTKELISGTDLCAVNGHSPYTLKLYIL